jgi:hypothetical protein
VEYTNLIDTARALETKYAYNLDKAKEVIDAEMTGMGTEPGSDGKWHYNGKPVKLIFLIRPDGDGTRKPIGDYFALPDGHPYIGVDVFSKLLLLGRLGCRVIVGHDWLCVVVEGRKE